MKTLIVGAGLTGLMTGLELSAAREVVIFDKARGVGGRLATRRTDEAKFDHGAQFYRLKDPLRKLHERWLARGIVAPWFSEEGLEHFCAVEGMTALAKDLARELDVVLNERVATVSRLDGEWVVIFESGRTEKTDEIVFTCPVSQTLDILGTSGLAYPPSLDRVTYSKLLVVLIERSPQPFRFPAHGYLEPSSESPIFSVANQHAKGVSKIDALTATLKPEASEKYFDSRDEEILRHAIEALRKLSPDFEPGPSQVKKWRYGQILQTFDSPFLEPHEGLYLAGDGFGGASLNGAARSANALSEHLVLRARMPKAQS